MCYDTSPSCLPLTDYFYGGPEKPKATLLLVHGCPDLAFGWRYQIPVLIEQGYRVIAPDVIGYGQTDAPSDPDMGKEVEFYGFKRAADDLVGLVKQIMAETSITPVVAIGHDWGGAIVYRLAQYHPGFLAGLVAVCTPFMPVSRTYYSVDDVIKTLPNFGYQRQLAGFDLEKRINELGDKGIRGLLNAQYYGRMKDGRVAARIRSGIDIDLATQLEPTPLMSTEELDYYVSQYAIHGVHGPFNWYRTRRQNWKDEHALPPADTADGSAMMTVPTLFIQALRDQALPPSMAQGMPRHFKKDTLTIKQVDTSHWALWEKPDDVNAHISEWLQGLLQEPGAKAKL